MYCESGTLKNVFSEERDVVLGGSGCCDGERETPAGQDQILIGENDLTWLHSLRASMAATTKKNERF